MIPYEVEVEECSKLVNVRDLRESYKGALIVTLRYRDDVELCSEEFQQAIRDAVALAEQDEVWKEESRSEERLLGTFEGPTSAAASSEDACGLCSEDSPRKIGKHGVDEGFWEHALSVDEDNVCFIIEESEVYDEGFWDAIESHDTMKRIEEDFRCALLLQEQEQRELKEEDRRTRRHRQREQKRMWGGERAYEGRKWGVTSAHCANISYRCETGADDFPELPPGGEPEPALWGPRGKKGGGETSWIEENTCQYNPPDYVDHTDLTGLTKLSKIDGLVDNLRQDEKSFVLLAAASTLQEPSTSPSKGVSLDDMRNMMAKSGNTDTASKTTHVQELLIDGLDRELYTRKSIDKLQRSMVAKGWRRIRERNHYVYQRLIQVPDECGGGGGGMYPIKQQIIFASTPSSQKAIDRMYGTLMKAERELEAKLRELKEIHRQKG
jgi:hypothetical protein